MYKCNTCICELILKKDTFPQNNLIKFTVTTVLCINF